MPSCRTNSCRNRLLKNRSSKFVIVFAMLLLCGCSNGSSKPPTVAKPFRGEEVELVVPASLQLPALWEVELHEWMDQTGATVKWTEYSGSGDESLERKLAASMNTGGRVVLFPLRRLSELEPQLSPIDAVDVAGLDSKDLYKGLRDRIVSRNHAMMAIPISAPALLCYYRADLLKAAGRKPPATWDDYQTLIDTINDWAPGLTAVEPLGPGHRATLFFARSLAYVKHPENYSVWFDLDSGLPLLNTAGFQEAAAVASRAWKKMPPTISELTPVNCREQVLTGKAALAIGIEPTSNLKASRASSIEIGVCRLPGSRRVYIPHAHRWETIPPSTVHAPAICGFDGLAIGVGLPKEGAAKAAWHLLSTLAVKDFESNWSALPKSPCRESQTSSASSWHETGLLVEEASKVVDATAQMLRDSELVADLPIRAAADFQRVTEEIIGRLLKEELDPAAAMQELQNAFQQIVDRTGVDKIRADYRRGLGIPAIESPPPNAR